MTRFENCPGYVRLSRKLVQVKQMNGQAVVLKQPDAHPFDTQRDVRRPS